MLKSAIILIIVSVLAMFFQSELSHVLQFLIKIHDSIADALAVVFSNAPAGRVIQETIALIIIPVIIGTVFALIWLMIKRNEMPHLVTTVWIIWTVLLVAVLIQPNGHSGMNSRKTTHAHRSVYY